MSKFIGIVEYQTGDLVKYINPSSLPLTVTKVDTLAELTIIGIELIDKNGLMYQICEVSDGKASTFATGIELMPVKEDEIKYWEMNKAKIMSKSNRGNISVKRKNEKLNTDVNIASNALNNLNLKKK